MAEKLKPIDVTRYTVTESGNVIRSKTMLIMDSVNCYVLVDNKRVGNDIPWASPYYALGEVRQIAYDAMVQGKKPNIKIVTDDGEVLMEMKINEHI